MDIIQMSCPDCKDKRLVPAYTKQGVEVDVCPGCKGVWLDEGEVFYFTSKPGVMQKELNRAIKLGKPSEKICPHTGDKMREIRLFEDELVIYHSPASGGIWVEGGELEKFTTPNHDNFKIEFDKNIEQPEVRDDAFSKTSLLPPLPNFFLRSTMSLMFLYGILFLCLIIYKFPSLFALIILVGIGAFQFITGPFIMNLTLRWCYKITWVDYEDLPVYLSDFVTGACEKINMKKPRFGIIHDGAPNAFTYGHTPNDARIVLTRGLLDLLNENEVKSVTAHEIGHAKHWDMLIMTVAQLVPLVLYYIYRIIIELEREDDHPVGALRGYVSAVPAYIFYIISVYAILWLSRTREYHADRFSGEITQNPNWLASGLVKIGYGLAGQGSKGRSKKKRKKDEDRSSALNAVGALGIFDPKSGAAMAVSSLPSVSAARKMGGEVDKEHLKSAMKWDLWNPWAIYYEVNSTHPLIAKRINNLSKQSEFMNKEPYIRFDERKPESYWDEFFVDLFVKLLPILAFLGIVAACISTNSSYMLRYISLPIGIAVFIKTKISYKTGLFPDMSILSLLKKVKVSAVRPVPCRIKGTIIGRGVPGLIWSEDFVIQDKTGIMFLDYSQPIPLWDFWFGLLRRAKYNNQEAEVTGWYRRAPVPYFELKSIRVAGEKEKKCYTYLGKYFLAGFLIVLGIYFVIGACFDEYNVGKWKDGKFNGQRTSTYPDGAKYVGKRKDGKFNGQGTYTYPDGKKYVGEFKNDKPNGQGTYTYPDGAKYVGQWKDGKFNGQGTYTSHDGAKYVGGLKDGECNGQGTYTYPDGAKYVGEYKDNKRSGWGAYTFPSGKKYVGEFKDDKSNGQGTMTYPDGRMYFGEFKDGKSNRQGTLTLPNGTKYVGELNDGVPNGQGTYTLADGRTFVGEYKDGKENGQVAGTLPDGRKFVGEWKDGLPNGQGTCTLPDGRKSVGEFKDGVPNGQRTYTAQNGVKSVGEYKDGKKTGQGTVTLPDGSKYVGEHKDGVPNGQGACTWPNGKKYVGEWKNGKRNGLGTATYPHGMKYVGEWKDGSANGQGTCTWPNGKKHVGEWKNGKPNGRGTETLADGEKSVGIFKNGKFIGGETEALPTEEKHVAEKESDYEPEASFGCNDSVSGTYIEINPKDSPAEFIFHSNGTGIFSYHIGEDFYSEKLKWKYNRMGIFKVSYLDEEGSTTTVENFKCKDGKLIFVIDGIMYRYQKK